MEPVHITEDLHKHLQWVTSKGRIGYRLDWCNERILVDLQEACLEKAVLRSTRFGMGLCGPTTINLSDADAARADFRRSEVSAIAVNSDFSNALFGESVLIGAFERSNFEHADFTKAKLSGNFKGCDFSFADFSRCDLSDALLTEALLTGARFDGETQLPKSWEKRRRALNADEVLGYKRLRGGQVVKLSIRGRRTACFTSSRCRAEMVEVIEGHGTSRYENNTGFYPGAVIDCPVFNDDPREDSENGITFYLTYSEAVGG